MIGNCGPLAAGLTAGGVTTGSTVGAPGVGTVTGLGVVDNGV